MRLFVALELPEDVRRTLADRAQEVRELLPPARWVPAQNLHLTLYFLGQVAEDLLPRLEEALPPVFATSPAQLLRLEGCGVFPAGRPARVAWVGVHSEGNLSGLQRRLARTAGGILGLPFEDRVFHAHVTLARPRKPWPRRAAESFVEGFSRCAGEWRSQRGVLIESRLERSGARYTVRQSYPFRP